MRHLIEQELYLFLCFGRHHVLDVDVEAVLSQALILEYVHREALSIDFSGKLFANGLELWRFCHIEENAEKLTTNRDAFILIPIPNMHTDLYFQFVNQ